MKEGERELGVLCVSDAERLTAFITQASSLSHTARYIPRSLLPHALSATGSHFRGSERE